VIKPFLFLLSTIRVAYEPGVVRLIEAGIE